MKHYKELVLVSLLGLLSPCFVSCDSQNEILLQIEGNLQVGLSEYITLSASYDGKEHNVLWESSNKEIATVSSTGMVKGLSLGKVQITATSLTDSKLKASVEVEVRESMQMGLVLNRFSNSSYKIATTGTVTNNSNIALNFDSNEYFYLDSYYFEGKNSTYDRSFGLGISEDGCFEYVLDNNEVSRAEMLRTESFNYSDFLYGLHDLNTSIFNSLAMEEDNNYLIVSADIIELFYTILIQHVDTTQYSRVITNLINFITGINFEIKSPYAFDVTFNFDLFKEDDVKMSFELIDSQNDKLNSYLMENEISYPEIYSDLLAIQKLLENHNYIRDLGTYKKNDGTSFSIGKAYYTEDYIYFDFSDQYIAEITDIYDYGLVNISDSSKYVDGVYEFSYINDELSIVGQVKELNYKGNYYTKYYDFYENATLIFEYINEKMYSFDKTNTDDYDKTYSEYLSNSYLCAGTAEIIFEDLVTGFDATAEGMVLSVKYDEENPSNSFLNYGIVMGINGAYTYYYSEYPYTSFNEASVPLMEEFLNNLVYCS